MTAAPSAKRSKSAAVTSDKHATPPPTEFSATRVCIKNLPPAVTEPDIRDFFQSSTALSNLEITDCKLLRNAKGKSRKVAFVGFRQASQARQVIDQYHRTYMRMCRLTVEPATAKTTKSKEAEEKASNAPSELNSTNTKGKDAPSLDRKKERKNKEFLDLLDAGHASNSKFWANDEPTSGAMMEATSKDQTEKEKAKIDDSDSDSSGSSDSSGDSSSDSESDDEETTTTPNNSPSQKADKKGVSDLDFLRSKQTSVKNLKEADTTTKATATITVTKESTDSSSGDSDDSSSSSSSSSDSSSTPQKKKKNEKQDVNNDIRHPQSGSGESKTDRDGDEDNVDDEDMNDTGEISQTRLFVRNLPFETTEEELNDYFGKVGTVTECHIPVDDRKQNKGFAFVNYQTAFDALEARNRLDKVDFQGRLLHILQARPAPRPVEASSSTTANLSWKQKQELRRKENETKGATALSAKGWSASFVRGDAVVDNLAERLGLRKGDILGVKDDLSSGDAAVRLALGETQVIEENREYFKSHNVDMEVLVSLNGTSGGDGENKRSKTALLVKNLPFDTEVNELAKLFQIGDQTVNILLPPSKTIAMVEYGHSSDAKRAFKQLAYRRFKHVPLYLEWAPLAAKLGASAVKPPTANEQQTQKENTPVDEEMDDAGPSTTIYVKNLNFSTTEEDLKRVFEQTGLTVRSVKIPQKVSAMKTGEGSSLQSMGYGFVELSQADEMRACMKKLQGKMVDGHSWDLSVSTRKTGESAGITALGPGKKPTKLVVRNVPFQASRTEILKLFGTFGQLRRVRLPKKFDGSHRGFAFVDFVTSKEAQAAKAALGRTHLYGRRLVLEWATEEDQNMDRLREKAQRDTTADVPKRVNKKIRFD